MNIFKNPENAPEKRTLGKNPETERDDMSPGAGAARSLFRMRSFHKRRIPKYKQL